MAGDEHGHHLIAHQVVVVQRLHQMGQQIVGRIAVGSAFVDQVIEMHVEDEQFLGRRPRAVGAHDPESRRDVAEGCKYRLPNALKLLERQFMAEIDAFEGEQRQLAHFHQHVVALARCPVRLHAVRVLPDEFGLGRKMFALRAGLHDGAQVGVLLAVSHQHTAAQQTRHRIAFGPPEKGVALIDQHLANGVRVRDEDWAEAGQRELEDVAQFTLHHFEQWKDAGKAAAQGFERGQPLAGAKFADGWNGSVHGFGLSCSGMWRCVIGWPDSWYGLLY